MVLLLVGSVFFIFHRRSTSAVDPAFSKYIESYTSGIISKQGAIRIRLAGQVPTTHVQNDQLPDGVFDFSPSIKGKAYWVDERTIEFRPDEERVVLPPAPSIQPNRLFEQGRSMCPLNAERFVNSLSKPSSPILQFHLQVWQTRLPYHFAHRQDEAGWRHTNG